MLLGTLAPLIIEALGLGKISVGPPYFNLMFLLPALPLVALIGVGMHTGWRMMPGDALLRRLRVPAIAAVAVGVVTPFIFFGDGVGADGAGDLDSALGLRERAARPGATARVPHGRAR